MADKNLQRRSFFGYILGIPAVVGGLVAVAELPVVAKAAPIVTTLPMPVATTPEPPPKPAFKHQDIIQNAFMYAGILCSDQTPSAEDYNLASNVLEGLIDEWRMERIIIIPQFLATALANRLMIYYGLPASLPRMAIERSQMESCRRLRDQPQRGLQQPNC